MKRIGIDFLKSYLVLKSKSNKVTTSKESSCIFLPVKFCLIIIIYLSLQVWFVCHWHDKKVRADRQHRIRLYSKYCLVYTQTNSEMLQKWQTHFKTILATKNLYDIVFLYIITYRKIYKDTTPRNIKLLIFSEIYNLLVCRTRIMWVVI